MFVKFDHPDFDLELEILTQMTEFPFGTPLRLLCMDFGCKHKELFRTLKALQLRYAIEIHNDRVEGGRVCFVQRKDWPRVKRAAEAYYERLYGNGTS